jgi:UDP-3-O-[3-hydroxymyristoyl] glucosamine N-acyltransferase
MKPVLIFGAGQIAHVFAAYLEASGYKVAAFVVDRKYLHESAFEGCRVEAFEDVERYCAPTDHQFTIGMSFNRLNAQRAAKFDAMRLKGYEPLTFIDHRASVLGPTRIGAGSFIMDENTIQPYAEIGENTILWSGNHCGPSFEGSATTVFIASHAVISGAVEIGDYSFIGVQRDDPRRSKDRRQVRDRRRQPDPFRL